MFLGGSSEWVRIAFGMGSLWLSGIRIAKAKEPGCHFEGYLASIGIEQELNEGYS
jgi:hypothetical protein